MKKCAGCHKTKPLTEFFKTKNNKSGLWSKCKSCVYKRAAQYRSENKEQLANSRQKWAAAMNEDERDDLLLWRNLGRGKRRAKLAAYRRMMRRRGCKSH